MIPHVHESKKIEIPNARDFGMEVMSCNSTNYGKESKEVLEQSESFLHACPQQ